MTKIKSQCKFYDSWKLLWHQTLRELSSIGVKLLKYLLVWCSHFSLRKEKLRLELFMRENVQGLIFLIELFDQVALVIFTLIKLHWKNKDKNLTLPFLFYESLRTNFRLVFHTAYLRLDSWCLWITRWWLGYVEMSLWVFSTSQKIDCRGETSIFLFFFFLKKKKETIYINYTNLTPYSKIIFYSVLLFWVPLSIFFVKCWCD